MQTDARGTQGDGEMSLDEIAYYLAYYGESQELEALIVSVLNHLPAAVRDFALDRCRFSSVGSTTYGMVLPGRIGRQDTDYTNVPPDESLEDDPWFILLLEDLPAEDAPGIVAHEIAHAWLGHDRLGFNPDDSETVAANLTAAWGFTGLGADPGHCNP